MSETTSCRACGVRTFSPNLPRDERRRLYAAGQKRKCGRGLCVNCYEHHRGAGTLEDFPLLRRTVFEVDVEQGQPCTRCGIRHRSLGELCQDCDLVVRDLGEVDAWAS